MATNSDRLYHEVSGIRDTIESIWVAIVLAFVLRAFMIEAFVIPTGSMAPRLMGEHLAHRCPACGYRYAYGMAARGPSQAGQPSKFTWGCPNCSYERANDSVINSGDRVLVLKYLYQFAEPSPWDVVVFRNPQNNHENYIKRLIGLPGEMIEIVHGDVFFRRGRDRNGDGAIDRYDFDFNGDGLLDDDDLKNPRGLRECPWRIRRKPPHVQQAMWHLVFDNDYRPNENITDADTLRYPTWDLRGWKTVDNEARQFSFPGGEEAELVFQAARERFFPRYGYNSGPSVIDTDIDICTDLKLSGVFMPKSHDSSLSLVLTSFENRFQADVGADGSVAVTRSPTDRSGPSSRWTARVEPLRRGRGYEVALAHADFGVTLRVDGRKAIDLDEEQLYGSGAGLREVLERRLRQIPGKGIPTPEVKFIARGGACQLRHLKLMRDAYYTSSSLDDETFRQDGTAYGPVLEYAKDVLKADAKNPAGARTRWMKKDPESDGGYKTYVPWGTWGNPIQLARYTGQADMDEFFVLGDNSPHSLDGRCWTKAAPTLRLWRDPGTKTDALYKLGTVPRYNMIGKALFVYWPAGYGLPGLPRLPIIPNAGKMRLIR